MSQLPSNLCQSMDVEKSENVERIGAFHFQLSTATIFSSCNLRPEHGPVFAINRT